MINVEAQFKYILFVIHIYCGTSKALNLCILREEKSTRVLVFTVIITMFILL
jgi:hypothetical protein